ncbi:hypothetical protein QVD17_19360 [Tagetes erecta]|uniref:S-protein homolog n=1 Tax=Tagetes erecta TaxID=13708 RepID=A0AAD8KJB9_TARER|nr:hypothetical protein QVD17_19360 [Tagetes erecta]
MPSSTKSNFLMGKLLFLLVLSFILSVASYANVVNTYDDINCVTYKGIVHIMSRVNNLRFHCHSKDDDLGDVTRNAGEEYQIRFCLDFFGRSRFRCHFYLESKQQDFNVYTEAPLTETQPYCYRGDYDMDCYWKVEEDGFYYPKTFRPELGDWVKKYSWE